MGPISQRTMLRHRKHAPAVPSHSASRRTIPKASKTVPKAMKTSQAPTAREGLSLPCSAHKVRRRHRSKSFPLLLQLRGSLTQQHLAHTSMALST